VLIAIAIGGVLGAIAMTRRTLRLPIAAPSPVARLVAARHHRPARARFHGRAVDVGCHDHLQRDRPHRSSPALRAVLIAPRIRRRQRGVHDPRLTSSARATGAMLYNAVARPARLQGLAVRRARGRGRRHRCGDRRAQVVGGEVRHDGREGPAR